MGIFGSIKRYFLTLGGLIESDINRQSDKMLTTPAGVKATFAQTRQKWTKQYGEAREAVAQLMMVREQKLSEIEKLTEQKAKNEVLLRGAVNQYKTTKEAKYQKAFADFYEQKEKFEQQVEKRHSEAEELRGKVEKYKIKLREMEQNIRNLDQEEAAAIADIVSSKQIISLNDRLNQLSLDLEDENLRTIENTRAKLVAEAKLSDELGPEVDPSLEKELMQAGMQSEASALFAAMLAEEHDRAIELEDEDEAPQQEADRREI